MSDINYPSRALNSATDSVSIATVGTSLDVNIHDGAGTALTSQVNGSQQALDVGINVAGAQVDPRDIRVLTNVDIVTAEQGGTWSVDATQSGTWSVDATQSGSWSVDATQSGSWSVDAVQSGTWTVEATDTSTMKTGTYGAGVTGHIIAGFDASPYKYFSLQIVVTGTGSITVEESNDNASWSTVPVSSTYILNAVPFLTITGSDFVSGYVKCKYLRVTVASNSAGVSVHMYLANGASSELTPKMIGILSGYNGVSATQSGTWNINNVSGTVSLPTGAATSAKQPALGTAGTPSADVITVQGTASMTALKVDGSAVTQPVSIASVPAAGGRSSVLLYRKDYGAGSVTTSAYTQVTASTSADITRLYIADTSGSAMILATGGAGAEVDKLYIGPGGNEAPYELAIPSGTRIAIKALDVNATSGQMILTALS